MTTTQIIEQLKHRREINRCNHNAKIKEQIKVIRKQIVEVSFQRTPDLILHRKLLKDLESAKAKLL